MNESKNAMSSKVESNYQLLLSIISQITNNGTLTGIDWNLVALDLSLPTANSARMRWQRFKNRQGLDAPVTGKGDVSMKTPKPKPKSRKSLIKTQIAEVKTEEGVDVMDEDEVIRDDRTTSEEEV